MDYTRRRQQQLQQQTDEVSTDDATARGADGGVGDLGALKEAWFPYRALFVPLNKVLEWNPPHFPAALAGALTFLFALLWYVEPPVLTLLSLALLSLALLNALLPALSARLHARPLHWTGEQDAQFERVCVRLCHARMHLTHALAYMRTLKRDKPSMFAGGVVTVLLLTAWVGSLIDNMLLLYIIVLVALLLPGLRKHGIQQQLTARISALLKRGGKGGARGQ